MQLCGGAGVEVVCSCVEVVCSCVEVVCSCVEVRVATVPSLCDPLKTRCGLCHHWRQLEPVSPVVMSTNETQVRCGVPRCVCAVCICACVFMCVHVSLTW